MSSITFESRQLWINGREIPYASIADLEPARLKLNGDFEYETVNLIRKWITGETSFELRSSGSTGEPKIITATRDKLASSAGKTIEFLGLTPGLNAVLCLNPVFTAGIMFIIRSLIGRFRLFATTPSANPLIDLPESLRVDLISLVPNQLFEIIRSGHYNKYFDPQSVILLGGGPVSPELEKNVSDLPGSIYHTFGMAETLSHIAIRKINGTSKSSVFCTVAGVTVKTDQTDCLIIEAPHLSDDAILTKDIVQLIDEQQFIWKGRLDHVIQSGGIKITVEWLEKQIGEILQANSIRENFFITSLPDPQLGEKIILIIEARNGDLDENRLFEMLKGKIRKYEMPKMILQTGEFIYTDTMKVDRKKTMEKIKNPD